MKKKTKAIVGEGWLCPHGEVLVPRAGWQAVPLSAADAPGLEVATADLVCLQRRDSQGLWRAELLVAPSELLRRAGAPAGRGLFSLRGLRGPTAKGAAGAAVAAYGGLIVARGTTEHAAALAAAPLAAAGRRHLLCVKRGSEWMVVDGQAAEVPPCLHVANDPQGTGLTAACVMSTGGVMSARRGVPALDLNRPLREQAASELSWSYGARYWATHRD